MEGYSKSFGPTFRYCVAGLGLAAAGIVAVSFVHTDPKLPFEFLDATINPELLRELRKNEIPLDDMSSARRPRQEALINRLGKFEEFYGTGYETIGQFVAMPHLAGIRTMKFSGGQVKGRVHLPLGKGDDDQIVRAMADLKAGRKKLHVTIEPLDPDNYYALEVWIRFE